MKTERGAYRQMSGSKVRREFDPFYSFGIALEAGLAEKAIRDAEKQNQTKTPAEDAVTDGEKINGVED